MAMPLLLLLCLPMHWLTTLLVLALVFFFLLIIHTNINTSNHPPSPFKLPIIGNLHQLGPLPHRSLAALSRKHGPLMLLHLGRVPTLVVSSADAAREVMKTQDHIFADRPSLKVPDRLLYGCKDIAFARYGKYWRTMRKLSIVHLLGPSKVRTYAKVREEEVGFMINKISRSCNSHGGAVINLSEVLVPFAKDVISRIVLGTCSRDEGWNEVIDEVIEESNELLGSFNFGDYIPRLSWLSAATGLDAKVEKTFSKLDRVLEEIVEGCVDRHCPPGEDGGLEHRTLVDVLLSIQKDPSVEISLTKESIKALIEDIFGAGMDSTLIVLEWCMAELMRNPQVMKKLQKEVRNITTPKKMVTEDDLKHMNYLKAVIKEILRFHPPGPLLIPRRSMENTNVQGYQVPKEAMVIVNCWAIGRDDTYWKAPDEFRPERFESSCVDFKGNDFQFIPFGAGRRVCPGLHLANSIVELALANLVYCLNWTLPSGMKKEDVDVEEAPGITSRKKTSLHIIAEPHSD